MTIKMHINAQSLASLFNEKESTQGRVNELDVALIKNQIIIYWSEHEMYV